MSTRHSLTGTLRNGLLATVGALLMMMMMSGGSVWAAQPLDRIVAQVNDNIILESELQDEIRSVQQQFRGGNLPRGRNLERQVMERLIMKRLQLAEAARIGITVDDNTLNAAVRRIAQQNNMNLPQFQQALQQQGMSFRRFREELLEEITIARLHQRQVERQVNVSQQEIQEFLQSPAGAEDLEFRIRHILIATPDAASSAQIEEARARARTALEAINGGENFAEVAARMSNAPDALEGGDLGWRKSAQIPTAFVDEVLALSAGDTSDIIRSASGFHVIKLEEQRSQEDRTITQTRARHILIQPNAVVTESDARTRLASLLERIEQGEDFAALARSNSDDRASASAGGDLNWISPGQMVPAFDRVVEELQPGQMSAPFQTQFGWHIVEVLDRREQDGTDSYRRARAATEIRERKGDEVLEGWLRRLRDEAYIDNRLES